MGDDEYHPIAQRGSNLTFAGGIGYTVIDVLDTMQIMDLKDEYRHARQWVAENLSFDRDGKFSTFEVRMMPSPIKDNIQKSSRLPYAYLVVCYQHIIFQEVTNFTCKKLEISQIG